jgi:hypothetical protein
MKMQRRREEAYDQASDRGGERYNKRTRGNTGYNPYYNYDPSYHHYPRRENVYYHDYHDHGPVQHPAAVQQPMMASSRTVVEPMCYPAQPQQQVRQVVNDDAISKKGKRLCRTPGCIRVIKSQGHCQRHGAKVKRCKVEGESIHLNSVYSDVSSC